VNSYTLSHEEEATQGKEALHFKRIVTVSGDGKLSGLCISIPTLGVSAG